MSASNDVSICLGSVPAMFLHEITTTQLVAMAICFQPPICACARGALTYIDNVLAGRRPTAKDWARRGLEEDE
jgi:hypothetical protein